VRGVSCARLHDPRELRYSRRMNDASIVAASLADIPVVQRLAHVIWHRHYPAIIPGAQIDYMLERGYSDAALAHFLDAPGAGLALATVDKQPVGFAAWCEGDGARTTKLDKLYVLHDWHRHGLGRRLIAHVERQARANGSDTLVLNVNKRNLSSIEAYRHCGFSLREAVVVDIGHGFVMDDYVMAKRLD
jgi:diamine N-acetyltransferase